VGQGLDARIPATHEAVALAVARAAVAAAAKNENSMAVGLAHSPSVVVAQAAVELV
jgi:hypothetical protein